jgi:3-dehydroquinate synthase
MMLTLSHEIDQRESDMTAPIRALEPITVKVALGSRSYDIVIGRGQFATLGQRIAALRPDAKVAIVTDRTVAEHYLAGAQSVLGGRLAGAPIVVAPGEGSKSYPVFEHVCEALIEARIERGDLVVALGGGVIGDLAGFAASVVRRGLDYVQVPTSLLAQVDSSVGGKTAIDSRHGKNLVGAFHQPVLVVADTAVLDTLTEREFRSGYAEVAKYGLIRDAAFFTWLETNWRDVFSGTAGGDRPLVHPGRQTAIAPPAPRDYAIWKSIQMKAEIVARDERETGDRALLNLGHTFGHAFEAAAGFSDRLLHGEAISLGMVCAFGFSTRLGLTAPAQAERMTRHLAAVGLPTLLREVSGGLPDVDRLMDLIAQDKKVKRGRLTFILARGIGQSFIAPDIDAADVRAFLADKIAERC